MRAHEVGGDASDDGFDLSSVAVIDEGGGLGGSSLGHIVKPEARESSTDL